MKQFTLRMDTIYGAVFVTGDVKKLVEKIAVSYYLDQLRLGLRLDRKNPKSKVLVPVYQRMIAELEDFQDLLDSDFDLIAFVPRLRKELNWGGNIPDETIAWVD